jgi:hypothetical protein
LLRLSVILLAVLWVCATIWGTPVASTADAQTPLRLPEAPKVVGSVTTYAVPTILSADTARSLAPSASTRAATPAVLPLPTPASVTRPATPEPEIVPIEAALLPLFTVIGTRVNMRAGPSTENPVVAALSLGSVTEALGPEIGGWIEIRDLDSGISGFMSVRFLEAL